MRFSRQRGVAAMELAITMIPLMILGAGMFEVGRALYDYNQVVSATRTAARFMSMQSDGLNEATARCLAVHGNTECAGDPILPGLTTSMVKITYSPATPTGEGSVDLVTVSIEGYPYSAIFESVVPSVRFAAIGTTMRQAAT